MCLREESRNPHGTTKATYPPGRTAASARAIMYRFNVPLNSSARSHTCVVENGTLPIAASNDPARNVVASIGSAMICACGCRAAAIRADVGSASTPTNSTTSHEPGTPAMNRPCPQPGSKIRPPVTPARSNAVNMRATSRAGV